MPSVDEILASSPLAGLQRVSRGGGDQMVTRVRLAEQLAALDDAPAAAFVILSRTASALPARRGRPTLPAVDIAERANIAMVSVPAEIELTWLLPAIVRETGGGA